MPGGVIRSFCVRRLSRRSRECLCFGFGMATLSHFQWQAVMLGSSRSSGLAVRDLDYPNCRDRQFFGALTGALIQISPTSRTEP